MRVVVLSLDSSPVHTDDGAVSIIGRGVAEPAECSLGETVKITLDDGRVLMGLECWWVTETEFDAINNEHGIAVKEVEDNENAI